MFAADGVLAGLPDVVTFAGIGLIPDPYVSFGAFRHKPWGGQLPVMVGAGIWPSACRMISAGCPIRANPYRDPGELLFRPKEILYFCTGPLVGRNPDMCISLLS